MKSITGFTTTAIALLASLVISAPAAAGDLEITPQREALPLSSPDPTSRDEIRLEAALKGDTVASGVARYRARSKKTTIREEFSVQVEDFEPGIKLPVYIDKVFVGAIITDATGRGELQLRTATFLDTQGDGEPIDPDFPKVKSGSVVSVGPLQGSLE